MTSASSSSARSLFAESKQRLAERVQVNMNNISSLARQIQRGSKSNEVDTIHFIRTTGMFQWNAMSLRVTYLLGINEREDYSLILYLFEFKSNFMVCFFLNE